MTGYTYFCPIRSGVVVGLIFLGLQAGLIRCIVAQDLPPVRWHLHLAPQANNEALITFTAFLADGWHLYAQRQEGKNILTPTFSFEPAAGYCLTDLIREHSIPVSKFDVVFGRQALWFEKIAVFTQPVELSDAALRIKGKVAYMAGTHDGRLVLQEQPFELALPPEKPGPRAGTPTAKAARRP